MAQDLKAADSTKPPEVDIDDIELEILILAKNPNSLKATGAFLSRRDWSTTVMGNISKAIEHVAKSRPDFVLISFNHPSPAIQRLPDLIAQTFNLTCVGFMEQSDALSLQKLTQLKLRHKIFGQPSGPNFQRTIRRILGERFNVKVDDRSDETSVAKGDSGSVTIRGEGAVNDVATVSQKQDYKSLSASQTVSGSASSAENKYTRSAQLTGGVHIQEGVGIGQLHQGIQANAGTLDAGEAVENRPQSSLLEAMAMAPDVVTNGKYSMGKRSRRRLKDLAGVVEGNGTAGNLLNGKSLDPEAENSAEAKLQEPDLVGMLKRSLFGEAGESAEDSGKSILEKATEASLAQICRGNPDISPIPLKTASRIGVFPIDSPSSPGYLVVAFESPLGEQQAGFLNSCETSLVSTFGSLNVPGKVESGFWLDLPPVLYEPWVENASSFNFKIDHQGAQIGIAFFPTYKPLVKARAASEPGMYVVDIEAISTEHPVTFKAYLHFEKNRKFYLYLRNGRRLQPEQKKRLLARQVSDVFMKSVDVQNFRAFLAGAFLFGSIKASEEAA